MPLNLISSSGVLCEKLLQEGEVFSAIRIVDVFHVPDAPSDGMVNFFGLVLLRSLPSEELFRVAVFITDSSGKRTLLPEPPGNPFKFLVYEGDPSIPVGFSLALEFRIGTSKMGTNYIEIDVNGEIATKMPFTLRRLPASPTAQ